MLISKKDVKHIAKLARIELSEQEIKKYEKELSSVLNFVAKLGEVNTNNIKPLTGGTDLKSVFRADEITKEETAVEARAEKVARLVKAAPDHKDGYVKVKAVFE